MNSGQLPTMVECTPITIISNNYVHISVHCDTVGNMLNVKEYVPMSTSNKSVI